jgi:hypothetical protein
MEVDFVIYCLVFRISMLHINMKRKNFQNRASKVELYCINYHTRLECILKLTEGENVWQLSTKRT